MASEGDTVRDPFREPRLRAARERVSGILRAGGEFTKRSDRMDGCGTMVAALILGPEGCAGVFRNQCRDRLCSVCAAIKAARHRATLVAVVNSRRAYGAKFSLVTLTIPHSSEDKLAALLDVLFGAMSRFRRRAFFNRNFRGWARGIEVTYRAAHGFHPHVHFIVEAPYIALDELHATWAECVLEAGGGIVQRQGVDIKGLTDGKGLNEAIGYPFKAAELSTMPADKVLELARAIKHRRMFSCARKWNQLARKLEAERRTFGEMENLTEVVLFCDFAQRLRRSEPAALEALSSVMALIQAMGDLELSAYVLFEAAPMRVRRTAFARDACVP